jgi:hypothetical protein
MAEKAEKQAQQQNEQNVLTRADVDEMAKIVDDLKGQAEQAASANNRSAARMLQLAIKQLSPIVTKGYARLQREDLARLNKKINPPKFKLVRQPI